MRLWSLHPSYLDAKGLVALWREALLAQHVLMGKTKGYKNHPQLERFKEQSNPKEAIAFYLRQVFEEAKVRNYNFSEEKIGNHPVDVTVISVTKGQVEFEWQHLCRKLKIRDLKKFKEISVIKKQKVQSLFKVVPGSVASWEKV